MTLAQAPIGLRAAAQALVGLGGAHLQARLTASDGGGFFGEAVAISGSTAVVGSPANFPAGAAYVFVRTGVTWSQQAKLNASDGANFDLFGSTVAISGSTVVVGAAYHNSSRGAAYVFVGSGAVWSQQAELTASDGVSGDFFGRWVAISGSRAVVGADYRNSNAGAAYVFRRTGTIWSQQAELTASDGASKDYFGFSVAIAGSIVAVGAVEKNAGAGTVYIFVASGAVWSQQAEFSASDSAPGDEFGASLAISGTTAVVGARSKNSSTGVAYVFVSSGTVWSQQAELTAADGTAGDSFGNSVAISGSNAIVGSPYRNSATGAAYVFDSSGTTWSQQGELTASHGRPNNAFGMSVALWGSFAVAGAPHKVTQQGAAYVFVVP